MRIHTYAVLFLLWGCTVQNSPGVTAPRESSDTIEHNRDLPQPEVRKQAKPSSSRTLATGQQTSRPIIRSEAVVAAPVADCPDGMTDEVEGYCMDSTAILFKDYENWCLQSTTWTCTMEEQFPYGCLAASDGMLRFQHEACEDSSEDSGACSLEETIFVQFCFGGSDFRNLPMYADRYCRDRRKLLCLDEPFAAADTRNNLRRIGFRCCLKKK